MPHGILTILQDAMAAAIHPVFWVAAVVSFLAIIVAFLLPKVELKAEPQPDENVGEKMIMAEQTTINARNQPVAESD